MMLELRRSVNKGKVIHAVVSKVVAAFHSEKCVTVNASHRCFRVIKKANGKLGINMNSEGYSQVCLWLLRERSIRY